MIRAGRPEVVKSLRELVTESGASVSARLKAIELLLRVAQAPRNGPNDPDSLLLAGMHVRPLQGPFHSCAGLLRRTSLSAFVRELLSLRFL